MSNEHSISRRSFISTSMTAAAAISAFAQEGQGAEPDVSLRDKFHGCIAGSHTGSAMGAVVEGWDWQRIKKKYGVLKQLYSYEHYGNKWKREPGTTEDGIERQKLMIWAILEKQDRVTAEDVRKAWVDHMNPNAAGLVSEPFEGQLYAISQTQIPACDIGRYCDYSGLVSLSRSCHPIGLINAGDVEGAIQDVRDVGQLYNTTNSRGIQWAEVTVTGIASAAKPGATVDSVLGDIFDHCGKADPRFVKDCGVLRELERGLKAAEGCHDFRELREKFDSIYSGQGMVYANSYANEIVTKAVCIFRMVKGNTWDAMVAAVNFGRDTDCLAAVSTGISGSLTGASSIPPALLSQVDRATRLNPHTNMKKPLREVSDGLYNAFKARLDKMKTYVETMNGI